MAGRRRDAWLRFECSGFPHSRPIDEIRHVFMVHNDRNALERSGTRCPEFDGGLPALGESIRTRLVQLGDGVMMLDQPPRVYLRDFRDIARIEMDVRVPRR